MTTSIHAPDPTESVFVRLAREARERGAVNLAQGTFDHGPEPTLLAALETVLRDDTSGAAHQYSPSPGDLALREAIAAQVRRCDAVSLDPDTEITVTAGASEALHCTVAALVRTPGDEVIVVEPAYEQYEPVIVRAGGVCRRVTLSGPTDRIDAERLAAVTTTRTRAIIVNTPWNPFGRCLDDEEWQVLDHLAQRHGVVVVSDEPYEHLAPAGTFRSVLDAISDPTLRVKVSSISKTLAATGWRVGWVACDASLSARIRAVHQFVTFAAPTPLQVATAAVLADPATPTLLRRRADDVAASVDRYVDSLSALGLDVHRPQCGFFVLADVGVPAAQWAHQTIREARVATLPIDAFYQDTPQPMTTTVRFALCKRSETLTESLRRLSSSTTPAHHLVG